jgi:hypothetical protein
VGHGRGVDGSLHFQIALPVAELIEQPASLAEKCGDEVDLHLVEKPSVEALLREARPTGNRDVFVAGGLPSLGERGLEAVRDEDERRAALLRHGFPRVVGENEHRHTERRIVSPPAVRDRIVFPRALPR